ncbi:hypothetical protein HB981_07080 [Listeria seeligeri]|uniref:hypothetical protein n=1 Tax=Listeria seeligeri TaxID=1640 RepID=UPI001627E00E|nr:hypothetical protein [Listeria seeligeri]MBC1479737.1 hypothetical protein [Listeria seeligeri]MBC1538657.1 hypothetical protein [Listeria seeligeri]MBC1555977.1 hypothetical protein [Listeria seeligeri]MBC1719776.1 hypothetical protein [Listeria seeligeri]MBC1726269.1 hypothetical protein [Listeria seeligeri]
MSELFRTGIRLKIEKLVHPDLKRAFIEYAKWLRMEYDFPIRVPVYVKAKETITTSNKEEISASFFAPFCKEDEPYIRIATGDYEELDADVGREDAIFATLNSLSHELQHYHQWIDDEEVAEEGAVELTTEYINWLDDNNKLNFV